MTLWQDKRLAWLALYLIPGLGNRTIKRLIQRFEQPEGVFEASRKELMTLEGMRETVAHNIVTRAFLPQAERELERVEASNARIVLYTDPAYPVLLKEIYSPPMLLYVKGKEIPPLQTFVALVGSRNPTHYGLKAAETIAAGLARQGIGVVSGLARGIDSAAHRGCLRGEGFTVAVVGTGIDKVYPAANKPLFEQVADQGAVVSEFPTGTPPEARNFPIRNRVISGLSRGVAVVEATLNSGSLITASMALDQDREVFAVPGSIDSFKSRGTHYLIKQGAGLIENAHDILMELGMAGAASRDKSDPGTSAVRMDEMDEVEKRIYELIGHYPVHMDHIARSGALDPGEVSSVLMNMELKGLVRQLPGKMFVR